MLANQKQRLTQFKSIYKTLAKIAVISLLLAASQQTLAQEQSWSAPVMISTNTISSWFSDVAVDDWGQPHVVWNSGRSIDTDQGRIDLLMYSKFADQSWLEPNDIQVPSYGAYTIRPAIAVNNNTATLHVTFRSYTTIYHVSSPISETQNAFSWIPRKSISGAGAGTAYYSDVAVDKQGNVHVVWNESASVKAHERWLWFGTLQGAALYDGRDWQYQQPQAGLGDREIYSAIEDSNGVQWFGTDQGVYRYDGGSWQRFTVQDGLSAQKINCVAQDTEGRLWAGTDTGVNIYDELDGRDKWITYTVSNGLPNNTVHAIATDPLGMMWLGTDQGPTRYDGQNWMTFTLPSELAATVSAIAVDDQRDVWVGTKQGIGRYNGQDWTTYTVQDGLASNVVTAIAIDKKGTIWSGTDKGLSSFDGQEWTSYTNDEGLKDNAVTTLMVDSKGTVWVGTETGVNRYSEQTWEIFDLPEELVGKKITAIAQDRRVNAICPSCADIFYRRSTDEGQTWSASINLSKSFAGSVKPQVRVGSGSNVYVTWEEGEDWYAHAGYPVDSAYIHSPDGGNTWAEPTLFSSPLGAPQQITLGVSQENNLVVIWRLPQENSPYYYQTSTNDGATWSQPEPIPGVIAKEWEPFSLDAYDADTDSAGNVHLLVLGYVDPEEEDLGLVHLLWNGSEWSLPTTIYKSSDPPEWPRVDIGRGNTVYVTWFTRDERHINDSERGWYKVWVSSHQANAPLQVLVPTPTPSPTLAPVILEQTTHPSTPTPTLDLDPNAPNLLPGLYTENDEIKQLILALVPTAVLALILVALRFGWLRRRG